MKAFLMSLVLLAVITAAAAVTLSQMPRSAQDVFTQKSNVRL